MHVDIMRVPNTINSPRVMEQKKKKSLKTVDRNVMITFSHSYIQL